MDLQKQRKDQFMNLQEEKDRDIFPVNNSEFSVVYVGSTGWSEGFTCVEDLLGDIDVFPRRGKFWMKKSSPIKVKLLVDISGVVVYADYKEIPMVIERFDFCNISEVIYCGHAKEYSRHIIIVARRAMDGDTKAHVMICDNVKKAKLIYHTFLQLFAHGVEVEDATRKNMENDLNVHAETTGVLEQNRTKCSIDKSTINQDNVSNVYPRGLPKGHDAIKQDSMLTPVDETSTENGFTKLARSRSVSTEDHPFKKIFLRPRYLSVPEGFETNYSLHN